MPGKLIKIPGRTPFYATKRVSLSGTTKNQSPFSVKIHEIANDLIKDWDSSEHPDKLSKANKKKRLVYLGFWHDEPEIIIRIVKETPRQWLHISRETKLEDLITDKIIDAFGLEDYRIFTEMTEDELAEYDEEQKKLRGYSI